MLCFSPEPGNYSGKPVVGLDPIVVHCLSKGMFATTNIRSSSFCGLHVGDGSILAC